MTRLLLLGLLLLTTPALAANPPAAAAPAAPVTQAPATQAPAASTGQDKLQDLGDYSLALGRKFGCDGKGDEMVFDIKRFTYVLQFDDADGPAAQTIAKKNLTDGIGQTKGNAAACSTVSQRAQEIENAARNDRPLMLAAGHNVGLVAGASMACGVPDVEAQLLQPGMAYTHNDGAETKATVAGWIKEGQNEVDSKNIGCDNVKTIFDQVKSIFTP